MPEFRIITVNKAKSLIQEERTKSRKHRKKSPIIEEYESYLRKLECGKAIGIALKEGDKFQTIKYRLNNAAKSLGMKNIKIERAGNKVIVYREIRPRAKKAEEYRTEPRPVQGEPREEVSAGELDHEPYPQLDVAAFETSPAFPPPTAPTVEAASAPADTPATASVLTPSLTPRQDDDILAFDEEWEDPMIRGRKTCEARVDRYSGLTFEAFGDEYAITKVEYLPLGDIAEKWFKEHGLYSPKEFREVWKQIHGGVFDPEQKVSLHHFKKSFEAPVLPHSDAYPE